ncbi:MAG: tryptophan 7-halogenase [Acidobacteria bacterium]|nr:tryptophan 7-halogenase [Acidobacteriota bacterium]MBV9478431.1 tryptophan 7-halogenase [Acidobacteriota bacterium]
MTPTRSAEPYDYDFAIAGGGPAGCATAIRLREHGHSVVLLERDTFPRFHIGESLLSTANDAFVTLGVAERIAAAGFPEKWGARLVTHDGKSGRGVNFGTVREVRRPQTYQVSRAEFDMILLDRAREVGAEVREGVRVTGCEFTRDAAHVDYADEGSPGRLRVRALVDATGRNGLLARKFDLRADEPLLANIAIYSHYKKVPRLADGCPNDIRIIAREDAGWFWFIPISDELTSVGVVLPQSLFLAMEEATPEERFDRTLRDTMAVAELMRDAERAWPVRVEKDFSYSASKYAGERWILAGDAGSFLDPVFSTGVSIALESGIEAADELDRARKTNDFSEKRFAAFSRRQKKRFEIFRRFVIGFYTPEFRDLFFQPDPPPTLFRSVTTVLAGRWDPSLRMRLLNRVFFALVAVQKRFAIAQRAFRRDAGAGYPR